MMARVRDSKGERQSFKKRIQSEGEPEIAEDPPQSIEAEKTIEEKEMSDKEVEEDNLSTQEENKEEKKDDEDDGKNDLGSEDVENGQAVESEIMNTGEEMEKNDEERNQEVPSPEHQTSQNEVLPEDLHTGEEEPRPETVASPPPPYLDDEEENLPLQPEKFHFDPKQYTRSCRIASRCMVNDTLNVIGKHPYVLEWFTSHPQFKHIFHMEKEPNRRPQAMWMLLLHQAYTEKENELWFVVNGVPIRYSMKEHALMTGLDCHDYPSNFDLLKDKEKGDFKFVVKWFKRSNNITIADVELKLQAMKTSVDKKKMAALYFLSKVIKAKSRLDGNIEPFLLKVVDDLKLCERFPWGRYTFDGVIAEVKKINKKYKRGILKDDETWTFSGFVLPLEAFPYECIPSLGCNFRVAVEAEEDCPRLCKHMFKESYMRGFPLEDLYEVIGETKDIISILEPTSGEEALLDRIIEPGFDDGIGFIDPIVEGWRDHLIKRQKKIFWQSLYEMELAGRRIPEQEENEVPRVEPETSASILELQGAMERMAKVLEEVMVTVGGFSGRLKDVENDVKELRSVFSSHQTGPSTPFQGMNEDAEFGEDDEGKNEEDGDNEEEKDEDKEEEETEFHVDDHKEEEVVETGVEEMEPPTKKRKQSSVKKRTRVQREVKPSKAQRSPFVTEKPKSKAEEKKKRKEKAEGKEKVEGRRLRSRK